MNKASFCPVVFLSSFPQMFDFSQICCFRSVTSPQSAIWQRVCLRRSRVFEETCVSWPRAPGEAQLARAQSRMFSGLGEKVSGCKHQESTVNVLSTHTHTHSVSHPLSIAGRPTHETHRFASEEGIRIEIP